MKLSPNLLLTLCGFLPYSVFAHGPVTESNSPIQIWGAASMTWHSQGSVGQDELWRIPGTLMGGDSYPTQQGFAIDDAFIAMSYRFDDDNFVMAKAGVHNDGSGHSSINAESLFLHHNLFPTYKTTVDIGLIHATFSPTASYHSSQQTLSEAPLITDIFWGRTFHDTGIRLHSKTFKNIELGFELFQGNSFPATPGEKGGSQDIYLKFVPKLTDWHFASGVWAMNAEAYQRSDMRYSDGGHSHSTSFITPPNDVRFSGTTQLAGAWLALRTPKYLGVNWGLETEVVGTQSDGEIFDSTRQADYQSNHLGFYITPSIYLNEHQFSYRYERVAFDNTVTGSGAGTLSTAENANLQNEHTPERQILQWKWQTTPLIAWRFAFTQDKSLSNESIDRYSVGLVWGKQKY